MSDLIRRLVALANFEHDGVEIGFEAAGKIIEQAGEIERLRAELEACKTAIKNFLTGVSVHNSQLTPGKLAEPIEGPVIDALRTVARKGEGEV